MDSGEIESYSIEEVPSDRRVFTRLQPDEQMRQTLLVYRGREYPARLMNLSAGGCEVVTSLKVKTKPGDELMLLSKLGRFLTRVAHAEESDGDRRLGLRLVGEFLPGQGKEMRVLEMRRTESLPANGPSSRPWLQVLAVLFVAVLASVLSNAPLRQELWDRVQDSLEILNTHVRS